MAVVHKMYNGEVEMAYEHAKHAYVVNGIKLPSVTKITGIIDKPALIWWAVNETVDRIGELWQPERVYAQDQIDAAINDAKSARFRTSQKALSIGSQAHDWIEQHIKAKIFGFDPPELPGYEPVRNAVESFLTWEKDHDITYHSSERKVYSRMYKYSGTADIDMTVDGKRMVADLKTSKDIYPEYMLQCSAYALALTEEDGTVYDSIAIIRIPKDGGEIEIKVDEDVGKHFETFICCLRIWRWQNPDWDSK